MLIKYQTSHIHGGAGLL